MEWLSQNWIWLALGIGAIWLLSRGRHGSTMGACSAPGMAHEGPSDQGKAQDTDASRQPMKEENAKQPAAATASSQRHGRGGCC